MDPLLQDLSEKKMSFKRNVVSLATELKDVRTRLATQEHLFAKEIKTRQAAESKAMSMQDEVAKLQSCLLDKDHQLTAASSASHQFLPQLDDLRSQLSITHATAESSAQSAESVRAQCSFLLQQLNEKDVSLNQQEDRVNRIGEQVAHLESLLKASELSQRQLRDEVLQVEKEITSVRADRDSELRRVLEEVENLSRIVSAKDEEIARLRDEIRILSAHWIHKTKDLESQLEKQRRTDQELKKKILKLEFCLQETRSQIRKLQRMGEKRDKELKKLRNQMPFNHCADGEEKNNINFNFWESSGFKFMVSMSMVALVIVAKR